MTAKGFLFTPFLLVLFLLCGCATKSKFVYKTEKELDAMEAAARLAHLHFRDGEYQTAEKAIDHLTKERTVSQPLYFYEKLSTLLLQDRYDEAHDLMLRLKYELDFVTDKETEEKASSIWHGEQNKVFKGDPYERCTLHAFLALSFLRKGDLENALACVKAGILIDSDTEKNEYTADYSLLYYLGYLCCKAKGDIEDAQKYQLQAIRSLHNKPYNLKRDTEGNMLPDGSALEYFDSSANTLLIIWAGTPPTMRREGMYKEDRIITGGNLAFTSLTLGSNDQFDNYLFPRFLADLNFQALTRGNRKMNDILNQKAFWKLFVNAVSTGIFAGGAVLIRLGGVFIIPGGVICTIGLLGYLIAKTMNPTADVRHWKNLPAELMVIPLKLPPGKQRLNLVGYWRGDQLFKQSFPVNIDPELPLNVIHFQLKPESRIGADQAANQRRAHTEAIDALVAAASIPTSEYEIPAELIRNSQFIRSGHPDKDFKTASGIFEKHCILKIRK